MKDILSSFWSYFKGSFNMDTTEQPIYLMTRDHTGSYIAMAMSVYNVYLLRQVVLKNAINLCKSNNPKIVKPFAWFVGGFYFIGLYLLWNIPCFFTQLAVRVYCATENATTNVLLRAHLQNSILNQHKLQNLIRKQGINI